MSDKPVTEAETVKDNGKVEKPVVTPTKPKAKTRDKSRSRPQEAWKTTSSGPGGSQNISELVKAVLAQMTGQMKEEQEKALVSMREALPNDQSKLQKHVGSVLDDMSKKIEELKAPNVIMIKKRR